MTRRALKLTKLPGFEEDVLALPRKPHDIAKMALERLVFIRDGAIRGVPLEDHAGTGDLSDCYKLYFDPVPTRKPRYRLVYRYTPNEVQAVALEAVSVGEREGLAVYLQAAKRLGRDTH
ncbi:hypothetical protein [Kocuria tytonicola]|uniref:hypothetical protein n=1 Tax=Kocuria tytonicola TaxID=2055946 RepID=UPI001F0BCEAF|nr:hypothetical protein [Kocuria tytonicola]